MKKNAIRKQLIDFLLFVLIIGAALGISLLLAKVNDDNNPFSMAVFILAVAIIACITFFSIRSGPLISIIPVIR